jgi:trans-aconitate 2-methyltransferase
MLNLGGAVAMQVPQFDRMPIARVFNDVASSPNFGDFFVGFDSGMHYFSDDFYYDTLSALSREVCIWSTEYFHVMENHEALIDWTSSTSMKPYTEQLPNERREEFTAKVLEELKASYKAQKDGKVLFPFKRLFFIAYK